jgi:DNA-binding response OmpR family regulator
MPVQPFETDQRRIRTKAKTMLEKILIIDDDADLLVLMRVALTAEGYTVAAAANGVEGLRLLHEHQPDLVLLDVMMPEMDGWETCRRIRAVSTVPIIFMTAKHGVEDKVEGLGLGADDYIVKPFHQAEMVARVNALLRRTRMPPPAKEPILRYGNGDLIINTATRVVLAQGHEIELTPTEYRLLVYMAERPGRVLTIGQIYETVWSMETNAMLTNVKWYIWRLRKKIEPDPGRPRFILTEPGAGYRFAAS